MTTLRDEDITTTTNTLPDGDADQSDSAAADTGDSADPAGVDPGTGGDADQSDKGDADSSDS